MSGTCCRISAVALAAALAGCATSQPPERGYLHVVVQGLPQCPYGIGYERPLRVELSDRTRVLATAFTSGIYVDDASLRVSLRVADAEAARYRVRVGQCPAMHEDPLASVACQDVDWRRSITLPLVPRGADDPEIVDMHGIRAECIDTSNRAPRTTGDRP